MLIDRYSQALGAFLVATIVALPASASVDRSAPPGGIYRLKPGIYVAAGSTCGQPANAAIRQYDGRGISTAHTRACRATVLSRSGASFSVRQSCVDRGAGPARRIAERQTVIVRDALTFDQQTLGPAIRYRYCPIYQLPTDLRKAAR